MKAHMMDKDRGQNAGIFGAPSTKQANSQYAGAVPVKKCAILDYGEKTPCEVQFV
jgi:hypothetical protein